MATIAGAKAVGLEKVTGSLAVGKDADILLLQADNLAYTHFRIPLMQLSAQPIWRASRPFLSPAGH